MSILDTIGSIGGKSGAGKGAAIGGAVGSIIPGLGTAVGSGLGTAIGGLSGLLGGKGGSAYTAEKGEKETQIKKALQEYTTRSERVAYIRSTGSSTSRIPPTPSGMAHFYVGEDDYKHKNVSAKHQRFIDGLESFIAKKAKAKIAEQKRQEKQQNNSESGSGSGSPSGFLGNTNALAGNTGSKNLGLYLIPTGLLILIMYFFNK